MSINDQTSTFITASGVFGGVGKALSNQQIFTSITFNGIYEVAVYAAISAIVGYAVKICIDYIKNWLQK